MVVSEVLLKWMMRFHPPLFFQRIWIISFEKGFTGARIKISKSILNRNYNGSIFGGTIFTAADPFYPLLFHQLFTKKGYRVVAWSKSSEIQFLKAGLTDLYFEIKLDKNEIDEAEHILNTGGKYVKSHPIDIYNKNGEICVSIRNEVYLRNLDFVEVL